MCENGSRYADASSVDKLLVSKHRSSKLDPFKDYLHTRWNAGCTDATRLTEELRAQSYRGTARTVRRYLEPLREAGSAASHTPTPPKPRQVTSSLTRRPDEVSDGKKIQLKAIAEDGRVADEERRWAAQAATVALERRAGRRMRARLARFNAPWQSTQVSEVLEPLIATHRASHPKADGRALQGAFDVAARWHSGQYRKSGDPYITHPLAVATILAPSVRVGQRKAVTLSVRPA